MRGRFLFFGPVFYFRRRGAADFDARRRPVSPLLFAVRECLKRFQPIHIVVNWPSFALPLAFLQFPFELRAGAREVRRLYRFINYRPHVVVTADETICGHDSHLLSLVMSMTTQSPRYARKLG